MRQYIKSFLKPAYYISEEDNQLRASVQMISDHKKKGDLNGHARAVVQAVHSIAFATLVNAPYYLALGSKNLILNCVHLNLELMVLGYYNAVMQNLIYSVIATIYVAIGTFIPPVLNGFNKEKSQPDDLNIPPDSSLHIIIEDQSETRSPTPSLKEMDLTRILSKQSVPSATSNESFSSFNFSNTHSFQKLLTSLDYSSKEMNSSLVTKDQRNLQMKESEIRGSRPSLEEMVLSIQSVTSSNKPSYSSIPSNTPSVQNYVKGESLRTFSNTSLGSRIQNEIRNEHDSISSQHYPNQANSIPTSSINTNDDLMSGDWDVIPNIESFAIKSINILTRDMIGAYGVNLERQAYRTALNEYIRILKDDFDIDLNERLTTIEEWLTRLAYKNNPIVIALYRTLFYLTKPVAYDKGPIYTHAKEQYEKYVTSLREVIAAKQNSSWTSDISEELKECLTLIRTLCEARFRSENHGLLRNLLQLHEDEYDRECETVEIPAVTRENFTQVVMAKNKKVTGAPALMKVSLTQRNCRMAYGAAGWEDFLMTDIPYLRGIQIFVNNKGEERSFYYIRHPTPHVQGSPARIALGAMSRMIGLGHIESGEAIAPEFEGMLEAIAERKESYLIQSHQRLNDLGKVENEDSRLQTLYRLQTRHKNFHVIFQAVEGDLFDRIGPYAKITTFTGLKEEIKASFKYENRDTSPNRLPACLERDEEYCNDIIDQLLNQVHRALFGGRSNISFDGQDPTKSEANYPNYEWQAFILAFYILQGDDLKFRLPNVKYFCTNCKNFFDRGGNRAMAEDRLHQEMSEREVTTDDLEATIANLIPVPLQSKGKAVIEKRLKPGLALAEILAKLPLEDRQRLQEIRFKEEYKLDRFEVSKKEQRAVPLIEDVCTLQEMQEVFKALQGKSYSIVDNSIIQSNWEPYQGKDRDYLFDQVNKDLGRFEVHVDKAYYNGQGSNNAKAIFECLKNYGISEDLVLKMMAQMQQSILLDPFNGLMKAFQHGKLELNITDTPEKSTIDVITTGNSIEIKAQNSFLYKTTNPESSYFRKRPIAVFNITVLVTIPKDGSAPHGQWTWEVADVPV
ncbi:MAG: hypothetical protein ACH349_03590 [Candidatus Rhabdochlamydia sp.]|jgi:hypothetical protein|nr:hypothetical protein [Chlamydiota bacterium]